MTTRRAAALVALFAALLLAPALAAQEASPAAGGTPEAVEELPPLVGELAQADRTFVASGIRLMGTAYLGFSVGEFDTLEHAAAAVPELVARIRADPEMASLQRTSAPTIADESAAFAGQVPSEGATVTLAVLIVRDGRYVHLWAGAGYAADPISDLLAIAGRLFGPGASPVASPTAATPQADALLDRLPGLDDLPPGFVLDEESFKAEGGEATPGATPAGV